MREAERNRGKDLRVVRPIGRFVSQGRPAAADETPTRAAGTVPNGPRTVRPGIPRFLSRNKRAAANNNQAKTSYRITWVVGGFMLALAIVLDLLQTFFTLSVFLILGTFMVSFMYFAIFGTWLAIIKVPPLGGRYTGTKLASMLVGTVVELVPVINALPAMTISILVIILVTRHEDRKKKPSPLKTAILSPREARVRAARDRLRTANEVEEAPVREAA